MLRLIKELIQRNRPRPKSSNYYDSIYEQEERQLRQMNMLGSDRFLTPEFRAMRDMNMRHDNDLHWLHDLYKAVIIPEVERFGFVKRQTALQSQYVDRIDLDHEQYSDIDEIMRLGYVHLFHRIEGYKKRLYPMLDEAFEVSGKQGIVQTMKKYYGVDLTMSFGQPLVREIAFIATSTKHTDGYPSGKNPPKRFDDIDPTKKIKVFGFELLDNILKMKTVSIDLWHLLSVVHHRRRLDALLALPHYKTLSRDAKEKLDIEHELRTGSATYLVRRFFSDVPEKIKRKWPADPDPWPLPEEKMRKLFGPIPKS